jgi:peptide/nickel transport system permease protein
MIGAYITRRVLLFFPTLFFASLLIFGAMRILPGDVASHILLDEEGAYVTEEAYEKLQEQLGLTDPLPVQYGKWIWSMVNGELGGQSLITKEPISEIVSRRIVVTAQMAAYTIVLTMLISIPLGILAAVYQNKWPDYLIRTFTIAGHSIPNFWLALMVLLMLVVYFDWSPPLRYRTLWEDPVTHLQKMIWPVTILTWGYTAFLTRITRSNILETLRQDYIRTARSKGLHEAVILSRHALRNALIPVITVAGFYLGFLLSGSLILENIFGVPGIGQGIIHAANERDYPVIQSLTLLMVAILLGVNLIIDMLYTVIDPRISYSAGK